MTEDKTPTLAELKEDFSNLSGGQKVSAVILTVVGVPLAVILSIVIPFALVGTAIAIIFSFA